MHSGFVLTCDISNFYPSVSHDRIYRLFAAELGCSPDVARVCTKLCTQKNHLALGLVTSPFLADQVMRPVDNRLRGVCERQHLVYTRYVDDVTISADFDLGRSGFSKLVQRIMQEHGFNLNPDKSECGRLSDGTPITKLRVNRGHLDVRRSYLDELNRQLEDAASLAKGTSFCGPFFTRGQIAGKVQFVCWVNPGRKRQLRRQVNAIDWKAHQEEAKKRRLVAIKKRLIPRVTSSDNFASVSS